MNAYQKQLLARAGSAVRQLKLLAMMAKTANQAALDYYELSDFLALLESPLDELDACFANPAMDEVL
ncbi:hypothetical protein [Moraxella nonliquefaciens]|uniref:hypothetical protein n=1 Tax=Moraxella nonliquefaciens TaxID=478 RepID=UPI001EF6A170|nr:hypothetical protein [Moraxella nonliquefaciens]MCG7412053.1 hypothetical protein [Moraxella nonliquefaciens]